MIIDKSSAMFLVPRTCRVFFFSVTAIIMSFCVADVTNPSVFTLPVFSVFFIFVFLFFSVFVLYSSFSTFYKFMKLV